LSKIYKGKDFMTTPIHDFLKKYAAAGYERCHMPGHGGQFTIDNGQRTTDNLQLTIGFDITEIPGAVEIITESERYAAELFGARRTLFSCSGSTLAIFAMLTFCANKRITAYRGAHRSLTDAAILLNIDIDWVFPGDSLTDCINPDTAAVFVTSIDCYGNMADVNTAEEVCKRADMPLLVDNAHGAYLVFTDEHPIRSGAVMCADSAHKTLPALTGAAYLHIADIDYIETAQAGLALFGTSSPSYLILNSLDLCNLHTAHERERAYEAFEAVAKLKSAFDYIVPNTSRLHVTIDANACGYTGDEYAGELSRRGVICEMSDSRYTVLLFSTITEERNTARVLRAMGDIKRCTPIVPEVAPVPRPQKVMPPREAFFCENPPPGMCTRVDVVTPPCVPVIIPGEVYMPHSVYQN
jgi:arginine/lysine/ornithine decarboxylase